MQRKHVSRRDGVKGASESLLRMRSVGVLAAIGLFVGVAGCGVNVSELLFSAADATGNTLVDILLTEFANQVVGGDQQADDNANTNENDNENGNDNTNDNANDNSGDDPGATLFASNCAGCHGADGTGSVGPNITGYSAADIEAGLSSAIHGSISLTADEMAQIATFLGG